MARQRTKVERLHPAPLVTAWKGKKRARSSVLDIAAAAAAAAAAAGADDSQDESPHRSSIGNSSSSRSSTHSTSTSTSSESPEDVSSGVEWSCLSEDWEDESDGACSEAKAGRCKRSISDSCGSGGSGMGAPLLDATDEPSASAEDGQALDVPRDQSGRRTLRLQIARTMMPYRWAEPLPGFKSCLEDFLVPNADTGPAGAGISALHGLLRGAMLGDEVSDETWLTSSFIDIVLSKFAMAYPDVHFMPIEFAAFRLRSMTKADMEVATDIIGRQLDYGARKPVIFLANIRNRHWNLLRVQHHPVPELQLFEPMGKPAKRTSSSRHASEGVSFRYIPKEVFHWLDTIWPLPGLYTKWVQRSYSAITRQQQTTGFDCGVASLIYAEKCGQKQMREDIDEWTTQSDMTTYRIQLGKYLEFLESSGD